MLSINNIIFPMQIDRPFITQFSLSAALTLPDGEPWGLAVVSHGFEGWKDSLKWQFTASEFADAGLACLRFDHLGCGESPGLFADTTLSGRVEELVAAVEWGRQRLPGLPTFLVGSSFGSATVLFAAARSFAVAVALLAAPADFEFLYEPRNKTKPGPDGLLRMGDISVRPSFFDDLKQFDPVAQAKRTSRVLLFHGADDELVPVEHAKRLHAAAKEPKSLIIAPGADHRLSGVDDQMQFIKSSIDWFRSFSQEN
jgi:uncharacterized protein